MKTLLTFILAMTLVLGLAACGSKEPANNAPTRPSTQQNAPTEAPTEAPTNPEAPTDPETPTDPDVPADTLNRTDHFLPNGALLYTELTGNANQLVKQIAYLDGEACRSWKYEYDHDQNLTMVREYDSAGNELSARECTGQTVTTEALENGWITVFSGKDKQLLRQECFIMDEEQRIICDATSHDENGNLVLEYTCVNFMETFREVYAYNENNQRVQHISYCDGVEQFRFDYIYDTHGRQTQELYTSCDGATLRYDYVYNDNDLVIQEYYYIDDEQVYVCDYSYNENGQPAELVYHRSDGSFSRYTYTYDDEGHLSLEKVSYSNGTTLCTYYNCEGYVIRDEQYAGDVLEKTCEYGPYNQVVHEVLYNGNMQQHIYYDEYGAKIRQENHFDGKLEYSYEYGETAENFTETYYVNNLPVWRGHVSLNGDIREMDVEFFNERGQVIQQLHYVNAMELWSRSFTYDENGNLLNEVLEENDNGCWISRTVYYYTENQVRKYDVFSGLNYIGKYDDQGRIVLEIFGSPYGINGDLTSRTEYEYAADGSYVTTWYGAISGAYRSEYDKNGNVLEEYGSNDITEITAPEDAFSWISYSYNEYGDLVSYQNRVEGQLQNACSYEYEYDANGNWVKRTVYTDGAASYPHFRTYDSEGRLLKEYDALGAYSCTLCYDSNGNLITMEESDSFGTSLSVWVYDEAGRISQEINYDK